MANQIERINYTTPVGRYITGDHTQKRTKDMDGRPIEEASQQFEVGLAVLKTDPLLYDNQQTGQTGLIHDLYRYALRYYQNNADVAARIGKFPAGTKQGGFSWKIKDGDTPNQKGELPEHGAGCYIFYFASSYPIKICDAQNREIDPKELKRGYYIRISGSASINAQLGDRAGIYLNPNFIQLCGFGEVIVGGLSAEAAFGSAPAFTLPAGASAIPVAPSGGMPGLPGQAPMPGFPGGAPVHTGIPPAHAQMPNALPATGPAAGFPSSGMTGNGPTGNGSPMTPSPIDPRTGQPVQPHGTILNPPLPGMPGR